MRVRVRPVVLLCCLAALAVVSSNASAAGYTVRGVVTQVVDGDTLYVTVAGGKVERVRLIGIDAPERGNCYAAKATAAAQLLAGGKTVTLRGDKTQATRDRYGRLLAYVWLPGGTDLGFRLIGSGSAKVYVYNSKPFERLAAYRSAEAGAHGKGLWVGCATGVLPIATPPATPPTAPPPTAAKCHPSYEGACLDPNASDYDCAGGSGNGPLYTGVVKVVGPDVFRLDADGDGYGCE
jgi:micrococcal nuclease